jgi:hypothetical protein
MRGRKNSTPPCSFDGCSGKSKSRGLCHAHGDQRDAGKVLVALHQYRRKPCSFDGCESVAHGGGLCGAHWTQHRAGRELRPVNEGRRLPGTDAALIADILSRPPTDECIIWPNWIDPDGYARTKNGGRSKQVTHIILEAVGRPVPDGECACHTCDVRACVNERHLWAGSHLANIADRDAKRRQAFGERNCKAKLTEANVREIRELRAAGFTQQKIADRFGVSQVAVSSILRGKTWGFVA